ncbi:MULTISPECIES: DUF5106 domain-containing protein [Bacteroides]|uniref:DUF5106 domain-containing protein n=1 Tax=Bacteroides intestinalis TaxID=329854 RepID=A0A4Q5HF40_9BACE|nr:MULTISPECIES: DUF5106 domain-containing protein [Bacteroides]KAA4692199.1 DUF5106 domain-containing protein [Bacteroides intestinalis]KAA4718190.1 DUF5106 domain-containing protein [Bacteroides intestinalis]RHE80713.1 DUF5106 domain-containing protein [Bacteroides intestinalis]RYT81000.1 DUF5106 domain-containing protein [Bacteroides intestinalis]
MSSKIFLLLCLMFAAILVPLRTPQERAAYLLTHFWDSLNFADTLHSRNSIFMEQNLISYFSLFPHVQAEARIMAVKSLMQRAEVDETAYRLLARLAEKHLYTFGSPMQNEEYFIPFLEEIVGTSLLDETEKSRFRFLLSAALKNRPGTMATDFTYLTPNGELQTLYTVPATYRLLLLFYDPDCLHCREIITALSTASCLQQQIESGQLTVLAICVGEDRDLWNCSLKDLPTQWLTGFDMGCICQEERYLLPDMPMMYLLDGEKRVVKKEVSLHQLLLKIQE